MFEVSALKAFSDNYIWTLIKDNEVTVVDPGDPEPVINFLNEKGLTLQNILITHHHFDHTGGIEKLTDLYGSEVYGPDGGHIKGIGVTIQDNQEFNLSSVTFKAIATPGHTLDHLSYYVADDSNPLLFVEIHCFLEVAVDYLKAAQSKCTHLFLGWQNYQVKLKSFVLTNTQNQI